jgi:hypothetical protein
MSIFVGTDVFVLMQVSRGFASQPAKPTGKEIKVFCILLDERM